MKIHLSGADGAEIVLDLRGPGDLLGESAALQNATRSANATALETVAGLVLGVGGFREFVSHHPRVMSALLEMTFTRWRDSDSRRREFTTGGSLARVASRLIELTQRFGTRLEQGAIDVTLPITQDDLASWSASSRESTARALRTLRTLGLIETRRRGLIVRDLDGLQAHARH